MFFWSCAAAARFSDSSVVPSFLFPELLIVIEEEEEDKNNPAKTDEERMADYIYV